MSKKLETPVSANEPARPRSKSGGAKASNWGEIAVGIAERIGSEAVVVLVTVGLLLYFNPTDWALLVTVLALLWSLLAYKVFCKFYFDA